MVSRENVSAGNLVQAKAWTFIANKQDLPNALSVDEIRQKLNLDHVPAFQFA